LGVGSGREVDKTFPHLKLGTQPGEAERQNGSLFGTGMGISMIDSSLKEDALLAEIVRRLVEVFDPLRIYLFGSRARGDVSPDSDYDLMVVISDEPSPHRTRRSRKAYEALRGTGVAADVLVWSLRSFESRLHVAASLPAIIEREGKLLYGA
jgi:predicted nucleotidyltransferase